MQEKEKDAALAKRGGQEEKKKKEVLKKKKKKGTKKNEGEGSISDKLQCDSSDSKSGSGDDSSGSKSGSGDDSKSESGCVRNANSMDFFFILLSFSSVHASQLFLFTHPFGNRGTKLFQTIFKYF